MLGERVVDPGLVRGADFLDRDGEARRPALQLLVRIVLGEVDLDGLGAAGHRAEEPFLEARDELPGAEPEDEVGGGAALEGLAVDTALEIDRDLVAVLRRRALFGRAEMAVLGGQAVQRLGDFAVLGLDRQALELEGGEIDRLDLRHQFEREGIFEILAVLEFEVVDRRLHRRADALAVDRRGGRVGDRRLQDLALHRVAEAMAQHGERHLADPEAGHADLAADLVQPGDQLVLDVGGGDADPVFAFEPFGVGLGDLHACLVVRGRAAMVRAEGLEPPRLAPPDPKSGVSASSTTPACARSGCVGGAII